MSPGKRPIGSLLSSDQKIPAMIISKPKTIIAIAFFISLNSTPINSIKKLTMELTMYASHPGYNTSLLLGGDEQLKKLL